MRTTTRRAAGPRRERPLNDLQQNILQLLAHASALEAARARGSEEGDSKGSPARSTCEPTSQSAPEEHQDQGNGIKAGDEKSAMMNAGGGQTAPGRSMAL
jgi:hypothetical protein